MSAYPAQTTDPGIAGRRIRIVGSGPLAEAFGRDLAGYGAELVDTGVDQDSGPLDAMVFAPWMRR